MAPWVTVPEFLMGHLGMNCWSLFPYRYVVPTCGSYREGAAISALCAFLPQDIRTVLNGPFRELKHDCNRGMPVMDNDVPQPRPGEVRGLGHLLPSHLNCCMRERSQLSTMDISWPLGSCHPSCVSSSASPTT